MNPNALVHVLAKGIRLFAVTVLLAGLATALQPAAPAVQAGPAYQP